MMHRKTRLNLTDLNPLLTCSLCKGYLIDATTLTECLHSFCRSCLVRYLQTSQNCPKCDTLVRKTRPLYNASSSHSARSPGNLGMDRALQNIVYKLVPGLFKDEMKKRRDFYNQHPQAGTSTSVSEVDLEARGEVSEEALVIYSDDEHMNLSLEYYLPYRRKVSAEENGSDTEPTNKRSNGDTTEGDEMVHTRYLRCPAAVCVKHIKKFIRNKFDLKPNYQIEITHIDNEDDALPDDYTLMDVAYIYTWRRNGPLPLVFRVFQEANKRQKTTHVRKPVSFEEPISAQKTEASQDKDHLPSQKELNTNQEHSEPTSNTSQNRTKPSSDETSNEGLKEQTTGKIQLTEKLTSNDTEINSSSVRTNEAKNNRFSLNEIVKEKIKFTLLNNNDTPIVVRENKQGRQNLLIDMKSGVSSLDTQSSLTTAVSVR